MSFSSIRNTEEFKASRIMEATFADEAEERGYDVTKATFYEDTKKHIDFFLEKDGISFSVDVKGRKKASRYNKSYDDVYTWVEFKNINGNPGWLYGGANYIVFEQADKYIFINREQLLAYCLDAVEDSYVSTGKEAIYKYYTRSGREDLLSRIKLDKAVESSFFSEPPMIWKKSNDQSSN